MNGEKLDVVRGSGNVFRDLGRENADLEQLKALLAAEINKALDRDELMIPGRMCPAKEDHVELKFMRSPLSSTRQPKR